MLLGYKKYEIIGDSYQKLYKVMLKNNICAADAYENKGMLHIKLSEEFCRKFEKLCIENGYEFHVISEKGTTHILRKLKKRPGIIAGFFVTVCLLAYFSNIAFEIRILTGNKTLSDKIRLALKNEGISPGCYIPDIDYVVSERNVRRKIDEISWVGITRKGCVLLVDTVENIPGSESWKKSRLPSNLTACEDAVIDKIQVKDGQVRCKAGDGVTKGEILVSGEVITNKSSWVDGKEIIDTKINYTKSTGKIYGTFEKEITFRQDYKMQTEKSTGKSKKISYINFFSAKIPLGKIPEGYYKTKSNTKTIKIFGVETPMKITKCTLDEYDFKTQTLDEKSAEELLGEKTYKFEQNFLKDYEIKDRKIKDEKDKNGIYRTVHYTLYGDICKETEFFINK